MSNMVKFPKIGQFRNIVQGIASRERFVGLDDNGDPIYDSTKQMPTITFKGTVKLHGTNSAVAMKGDEIWFQSRERIITPLSDNCGFAAAMSNPEIVTYFKSLQAALKGPHNITDEKTLVVFGEWIGNGVQKGVAISQVSKRFVIFGIRVVGDRITDDANYEYDEWLPIEGISNHDLGIYNVTDYEQYSIDINLADPGAVVHRFEELVEQVEKECPVGKAFGVEGTGEGIVFSSKVLNIVINGDLVTVNNQQVSNNTQDYLLSIFDEGSYTVSIY